MNEDNQILATLNQTIAHNPDDAKALARRGEIYRQRQHYEAALADFKGAIALQADYPWAIAHRGVTYRRLMRYEEALVDFNRAIELEPGYAWAIAYRGVIYTVLGRYQEALGELDRAMALDETIKVYWGNERGFPLSCLGRYAEAIASFEQTLQIRPHDPLTLYCIAVAKACWQGPTAAQTEIDTARTALLSLVNRDSSIPPRPTPHARPPLLSEEASLGLYGLGGLVALAGQYNQALDYLQEAISLERDLNIEMARHDLAWLKLRDEPRYQILVAGTPNTTRD